VQPNVGPVRLSRIVQRSGDIIEIKSDRIQHKDASGNVTHTVWLERDDRRRLLAVRDPVSGASGPELVRYCYNEFTGNLVQVLRLVDRTALTYVTNKYYYEHASFPHYITRIEDGRGVSVARNLYDDAGRLVGIIDAAGRTNTFAHDLTNRFEAVTDRLGNVTRYGYDARGNVTAVTNAFGTAIQQVSTFGYDDLGNQIAATNNLGVITRCGYDANGLLLAMTNAFGTALQQFATNSYDASGNLLVSRDVRGYLVTNTYDSYGQLLTVANADGIVSTNFYHPSSGLLMGTVDATGVATTNYYESATGNLTNSASGYYSGSTWNAVTTTTYGYDGNGNQLAVTNALGVITRYGYDAQNRVVVVTNAFGLTEQATNATIYDANGRVAQTVNALGIVTAFGYDSLGLRTSVTNALGKNVQQITSYRYDANGNLTNTVDALGRSTDHIYDALGRRVTTLFPPVVSGGDRTGLTNVYDGLDRRITAKDQATLATGFGYDALSRLTSVTDARNKSTTYGYDAAGNLTSQTDALTRATSFTLDALGRRTQRTLPISASETFGYDKASRLLAQTNFNALIVTNQYDAMGRLWKIWNGSTLLETRSYSALGQLTSRVDASGTHTWVYDVLGRLKTNSTPAGTLYYTYDRAGNLLTLGSTTSNGVTNSYTYDDLNRLMTLTDNRLGKSTQYAYDGVGNLTNVTYPTTSYAVVGSYLYDSQNRLTNLAWTCNGTVRAGFGYTLGPAGNRLTLAETINGTVRNYTWGYDNTYRLTSEQVASTVAPTGTNTYGYDDVGNRTSRTAALGLAAQAFNYDQRDQIDNNAVPTTASTYFDANGNTLSYGGTYTYDWANRLLTQASPAVTLTYDGDGNRIKKVAGGVTTWYLVATVNPSGYPQVVEELTGTTPTTLSRVYSYGLDLATQRTISGSVVRYFGYDGLGSTKFLVDPAGAVTDTYTYDAYGTLIASTGSTANNYRYGGEQWDPDLGMYYLRARYLNPNLGRFQTRDTFEGSTSDPLSLHKYLYCHDNPANNTDPTGMFSLSEINVVGSIQTTLQTIRAQGPRIALKAARTPIYNVYYGFAPIPPFGHSAIFVGSKVAPHTGWMFHVVAPPGPKFGTRNGWIVKDGPHPLRAFTTNFPFPNFKFTEFSQLEFMLWQAELKIINAMEDVADAPVQYSQLGFIGQPFSCHSWAAQGMLSAVATSRRVVLK
jgi:RHS repeat-associated protein